MTLIRISTRPHGCILAAKQAQPAELARYIHWHVENNRH